MFNKDTNLKREDVEFPNYFYFNLTEWIKYTKEEIEEDPKKKLIGGYHKKYGYKEAWKKAFKKASKKEIEQTIKLPNFDYKIFEEITGISKKMINSRLKRK